MKKIRGIQLDKRILTDINLNESNDFIQNMLRKLNYINRIMSGEITAAGNSIKFLRKSGKKSAIKYRFHKKRFSMILSKNILTCVALSNHDRQIKDIERFSKKQAGMVYYELNEFKEMIKAFNVENKITLSKHMMLPKHYVLSKEQEAILENKLESLNMSIVGNAGAGKSLVGMKWIANESSKKNNRALYLTMSENLVYALRDEFELELKKTSKSELIVSSIGEFIYDNIKINYPDIPSKSFLNSKETLSFFKDFWLKKISDDLTEMFDYYRAIHGYLKGALPLDLNLKKIELPKIITESEYKRLRELYGEENYIDYENALNIYEKYQSYLKLYKVFDDNDLARMIICADNKKAQKFRAVFIDECQDLTQVQTLAILSLLPFTRSRVFSSDRCQMVQPVWFKEGNLRTLANELDKANGKELDEEGIRAHYLHFNFRSSKSIIHFQNAIISFFREKNVLSLKQKELLNIEAPILQRRGIKPIWIRSNEKNKEAVTKKLWEKITSLDLQLIIANKNNETINEFENEKNLAIDVVECKGMEYPAVFMYNLMKDTSRNFSMALKYFYVAATRSSNILFIYDDFIEENNEILEFFKQAVNNGIVEECSDVFEEKHGFMGSYFSYMESLVLREVTEAEKLTIARDAMDYGQYKLALQIYNEIVPNDNITLYAKGKVFEEEKEYENAIVTYSKLNNNWQDKGRNKFNSVEALLKFPDIKPRDYLAAFILGYSNNENFLDDAKLNYKSKFGEDKNFNDELFNAISHYEFARNNIINWMNITESKIEKSQRIIEKIYLIKSNF